MQMFQLLHASSPDVNSRSSLIRNFPVKRMALRQVVCSASKPQRSFDNEDELDRTTSEEFTRFSDPESYNKLAKHLELLWKISERKRPEQCESCAGTGEKECTWCNGTGVMTIGDTIFCGPEGCKVCPVCRGLGECKCENCRGTGRRAGWLDSGHASPNS